MTHVSEIGTNCECRYTLTLTDQVVRERPSEMRDNFNHTPNIHEIDEDDTDDEYTYDPELENPEIPQQKVKDTDDPRSTNSQQACDQEHLNSEHYAEADYVDESTESENLPQEAQSPQNAVDNESTYSCESFCSDESCDETEATDATLKSVADSYSVLREDNLKSEEDSTSRTHGSRITEEFQDSDVEDETICSSRCNKTAMSEDNSIRLRHTKSRRKNMTFTDEEVRKIERENQVLLRKIMAQQRPRDNLYRSNEAQPRTSSSAINRKKLQRKIEYDNLLLLQKIQQAKSCVMSNSSKPGCRLTFL